MARQRLAALAAALIAASGFAYAQTAAPVALQPDQIIAARQGGYDLMSGYLAPMKAAVDAKADVKPFEDGATAIANWGTIIPTLFPDGTQTGHHTHARPSVWSKRAGFVEASAALTAAATKLAALAKANDKAGFADQLAVTGRTCGACHRNYRAR